MPGTAEGVPRVLYLVIRTGLDQKEQKAGGGKEGASRKKDFEKKQNRI